MKREEDIIRGYTDIVVLLREALPPYLEATVFQYKESIKSCGLRLILRCGKCGGFIRDWCKDEPVRKGQGKQLITY